MRRSRRIEFEPELTAILRGRSRRFKKGPVFPRWMLGLFFLAALAAGYLVWGHVSLPSFLSFDPEKRELRQTNRELWTALQSNNVSAALPLFDVNASSKSPASDAVSPGILATPLGTLQMVREDLTKAGIDWADALPVAFVGVRARALEPGMEGPHVSVAVGELYIRSAGALFMIELSTRYREGACQIIELWHWGKSEQDPAMLHELPETKAREFLSETQDTESGGIRFSDVRPLFLSF